VAQTRFWRSGCRYPIPSRRASCSIGRLVPGEAPDHALRPPHRSDRSRCHHTHEERRRRVPAGQHGMRVQRRRGSRDSAPPLPTCLIGVIREGQLQLQRAPHALASISVCVSRTSRPQDGSRPSAARRRAVGRFPTALEGRAPVILVCDRRLDARSARALYSSPFSSAHSATLSPSCCPAVTSKR
jgi:hypothetical protein